MSLNEGKEVWKKEWKPPFPFEALIYILKRDPSTMEWSQNSFIIVISLSKAFTSDR